MDKTPFWSLWFAVLIVWAASMISIHWDKDDWPGRIRWEWVIALVGGGVLLGSAVVLWVI